MYNYVRPGCLCNLVSVDLLWAGQPLNYLACFRQIEMNIDRQTDRQTERQTDRATDRQTDRQSDRQTDRATDRQTDIQTESACTPGYIECMHNKCR